jgi:hypothetical protein
MVQVDIDGKSGNRIMAHFAKIQDGIVREVIVIGNDDCGGGDFPASEPIGQAFIASLNIEGEWRQTSYSGSFRSKYAALGDIFTGTEFVSPEPQDATL